MEVKANKQGIRKSAKIQNWRMVFNDTKVLHLFESAGVTTTIQKLYIGETKEECIDYAKSLKLALLPESN